MAPPVTNRTGKYGTSSRGVLSFRFQRPEIAGRLSGLSGLCPWGPR
jgi:hypothetical protein